MERAKGFESVRGAVAHAMTCKNGPIYASRDARQPAHCCTDPRDFYRKLSQKSGAGSQVSWQKDRVTFRTSVWQRFHRARHLSEPAVLAHAAASDTAEIRWEVGSFVLPERRRALPACLSLAEGRFAARPAAAPVTPFLRLSPLVWCFRELIKTRENLSPLRPTIPP